MFSASGGQPRPPVQGSVAGQGEVQQGVGPPLLVGGGAVVDLIAPAEVEVQGPLVLLVDGDLGDVAVRHPPVEELGPQPGAQVLRGQKEHLQGVAGHPRKPAGPLPPSRPRRGRAPAEGLRDLRGDGLDGSLV